MPESNDGILLINSRGQYIEEAYIWDPLFGDTTPLAIDQSLTQIYWSQVAQGYCGLPSDYNRFNNAAQMFAVADGTLTAFKTALYVGNELFYSPSDDSMDYAGKPFDSYNNGLRHCVIHYNNGYEQCILPSIAAIGTPTFLSIGDGFYIGSNQFSPFRQIKSSGSYAGETVFASGYTILHAPLENGTDFQLGSVVVEDNIVPPTGAVKMQEFIELY